jgi:hypothetical protein
MLDLLGKTAARDRDNEGCTTKMFRATIAATTMLIPVPRAARPSPRALPGKKFGEQVTVVSRASPNRFVAHVVYTDTIV